MDCKKIALSEAIGMILVIIINQIFMGDAKEIIVNTLSSSPLNVIFISIISILLIFIITNLYKNFSNLDIFDISKFVGGNFLKALICIISISFLIFSGAIMLGHICTSLETIYFSNINILFLNFIFLLGSTICASKAISAICRTNLIFLYLTALPIIILWVVSLFNGHYNHFYPILGNGLKETLIDNSSNIFAFSGIIYLFFIMPFLNNTKNFKQISYISIIISSIYLILSVFSLLATFPYINITEDLLSVHLLSRTISIGAFFERVDALFVLLWCLIVFSNLSIIIFFTATAFKKLLNLKHSSGITGLISFLILATVLFIPNVPTFHILQFKVYKYFSIILLFIFTLILLIANFKKKENAI